MNTPGRTSATMSSLYRTDGIRVAGQGTYLTPCRGRRQSNGPRPPPRGAQMPMEIAGGPVRENAVNRYPVERGANRPGAQRGNRHSSATLGPSTLAISKIGPVANKPGAAAMEEIGMANGTESGAINGANLFDNRIEKTLIDPPSTPVTSRNGCSGQNRSSGSCVGRTGDGHSCSKRSKG